MRSYRYVGPPELARMVREELEGYAVRGPADFAAWRGTRSQAELRETHTFTVDLDVTLRLAPRQREHVVCAGGRAVLCAGEISFAPVESAPEEWGVHEISNQSTGYCPDPDSWEAVDLALHKAGIPHPGEFTHAFVFRRCTTCGHRNIVRESFFFCAICDALLPPEWNIDSATDAAGAEALTDIRTALRRASERPRALTLLAQLGSDVTAAVVPELVGAALSHRDALAARELLGRLRYDEAARLVPPAVWDLLAEEDDDDAYRRMAELLRHLGLSQTLRELCRRAAASEDPDIREVAEDFTDPASPADGIS